MDWLGKFNEIIDCARKAVRLTSKEGSEVEYIAEVPPAIRGTINQADGTPIESIPVICEYPHVFQKICLVCHMTVTSSLL